MSSGLARVTIAAPQRRLDIALPEHLPLAELLPEVLRYAGVGLADDGERHGGWVLRRTDGAALRTGQALLPQGVRDGEVLHLVPARTGWPELEYDDVVEVIADGTRSRGLAWGGAATRAVTLAGVGTVAVVGGFAVLDGGPQWWDRGVAALAAAVLLILGGVVASRAYGEPAVGAALGGSALPYAWAGGALLVASGDPAGPVRPVPWLGAPELLGGSAVLLLAAVLAATGVAAGRRICTAGVTVGLLGAAAALAGLVLPASGAAAVLMVVLVCGVGVVPLLAIRFGRLPLPPITLPAPASDGGPARDRPRPDRVLAAVARAEELLTGMLAGHAVLVAGAATILVLAGGPAGWLLAAVAGVALLLRCRTFVTVRQRLPMVVAGLTALAVVGVGLVGAAGPAGRLAAVAGGVLLALVMAAAGATYARRPPTPYLGRAADLLDAAMVVSVVPVACAVLGLYGRARGLLG